MIDELIRRCQAGDRAAIVDLIESHSDFIQKVAFRITRNNEMQKDIFQEVVRSILCSIGSFRGECAFTTWLFRIVSNASINQIRKEKGSGKKIDFTLVEDTLIEKSLNQLEKIEEKEQFELIKRELSELPGLERESLMAFYFGELSIEEISLSIGKTPGAIKAALYKGRQRIKKKLRKQGIIKNVAM